MTTARDVSRVEEIRNRCEHAIDAYRLPWARRPFDPGEVVISKGSGNVVVCQSDEEDDPAMSFIEHAPSDVRHLLALLADREALLEAASLLLRRTLNENTFNRLDARDMVALIDAALSPGSGKEGA